MTKYGVILFRTTSAVMRAEKLMLKAGYVIKLIPTPREFSSDCGIAVRFNWDSWEGVESLLEGARIEFDAVHELKK